MKKHIHKIKALVVGHKVISALLLLALLFLGYWGYEKITGSTAENHYITAPVEKGKIVVSISGSGQVSALNQIDVKSKVSGDVLYLGVRDGQRIGAGGLIAQLDNKDAQRAVRDAQINLESAQISLNKLKIENSAENMNSDLAKSYDDSFSTISNAFLDLPGIMTGLGDLFFKSYPGTNQWTVDWYAEQVPAEDHTKAILLKENFIDSYHTALDAYDKNFENYKTISRTAASPTIEALISETYATTKLISDAIKKANNYIDFVNNSVQQNNLTSPANIASHRSTLNTYTSETNSHLVSLLGATTDIKNYKDAFPNANLDLQSSELSVRQKENSLQDAKDKLADYFIRAPFDGTVAKVNVKKSDSVGSSTAVATLITKTQLAEISLNEVDVAKIKLGQKTTLTFDAIPELNIAGIVADIDALGAVSQGVVTYIVKISFNAQDERIKPGMSVNAAIVTDEKAGVLVVPNSAVKSQGGKSYVEVLQGKTTKRIPVDVGLASDSQSEIVSGIKEGDEIVTRTIVASAAATTAAPSLFGGAPASRPAGGGGNVRFQGR